MASAKAEQITGLVLAGGRGERLGGLDKGWVLYRERPLNSLAAVSVDFDDAAAFRNINTAEDAEGRAA